MNGYSKPIINPYKNTVQAPKKDPVVTTVDPTGNTVEDLIDMPMKNIPKETITNNTKPMKIDQSYKDQESIELQVNSTSTSTDEDLLKEVVETAAENAKENEDIEHIRELQHKEYENRDIAELVPDDAIKDDNLPEGIVAAERTFVTDASGKPNFIKEATEVVPAADVDILHLDDLDEINNENFKRNFVENTAKTHELSDEDAIIIFDLMVAYKKDKDMPVYSKLPESIKKQVRQICMSANIPMSNANMVARMMLDELIDETGTDQAFIDFEKSIAEAMKIPSLIDIYEEHISETVDKKLPAMAEAIKDEDPEKAQMLLDIADQYAASRTYSKMKEIYDTNSRIRKVVRRDYDKWNKFGDELNVMNENSKFRVPDATSLHPILMKVIANDDDNDLAEKDVNKFLTLLYRSCDNLHKDEIVDASYIYYLLKNISMLGYVNDSSAKTADSFSAELISNIKAMMYYIMTKEEEFYASNKPTRTRK